MSETKNKVTLQGLSCANCARKIEDRINELPEVKGCNINVINSSCTFFSNENDNELILENIKKIVKEIEPDVIVLKEDIKEKDSFKIRQLQILIGVILIVIGLFMNNKAIGNIFYLISYVLLGYEIIIKAIKNILKGNLFDENFLMSLATLVALYLGEYLEAASVMIFYQFGELFQDQAVSTSRSNITSLMDIRPDYANVLKDDEVITINPELVKIDEIIIVKPGEKIPLDGIVIEGSSMLDTSSLTGESIPREVYKDENVISGCLNLNGTLKIKVTKLYEESTVNKILELVENTSSRKAKTEKFITKFSKVYTPIVVISALLLTILLPLFSNVSFSDSIKRAAIFLIVSCPCALVLSIPLSFYSGIGGLSKMGVLVKGSTIVETLSKVKRIVFDKTGTLTKGKFYVDEIKGEDTLRLSAYAEYNSNHPIAKSILSAYKDDIDINLIQEVKEHAGYGIEARLKEGTVLVGNKKLMDKHNIIVDDIDTIGTIVYVSKNNNYVGYIVIKDKIKDDAKNTVKLLKDYINHIVMLTGDNETVSKMVGNEIGINEIYSDTLPNQKVEVLKSLLDDNITAFVGDGINDAPVLALSDIGIAMGAMGSDAAIEAADVVIMDDSLSKIPLAIKQSKKTMNIIVSNIVLAIGIKLLVLLLSAFGFTSMWLAIFADVGVSIICILNSIRLLTV
ncbi:MAG: cadmium-translocating P-type ATPase [Erysipelotrichaceae bacterium]|jgi:Cd2+/Zn2+-exporting ATPase|nr:cadmium-translocating P-type ATPase [Erysipelotrichaceae bacterium]